MAAMSDWLENKCVDFILRGQAWTPPGTLYVSLHTTSPLDTGAGGGEVSTGGGTNYARKSVTSNASNWAATQGGTSTPSSGTGGVTSNVNAITFDTAPGADWGIITHFGLWDASTGGNLVFHGALTTSRTISNGQQAPSFAAGALSITFA
jgi:hypothetical protein